MTQNKKKLELILEKALCVFAKYGFKKTTMDDIAKELGMTQPNLYIYVKNKKDLYEQSVSYEINKLITYMREAVEREKRVEQKIIVLSQAGFEYIFKNPNLRSVLINDQNLYFQTIEKIRESQHSARQSDGKTENTYLGQNLLTKILEDGIKDEWFRDFNVEVVSTLLSKIWTMFIKQILVMPDIIPKREMTKEIVNLVLYGIVNHEKKDKMNKTYDGYNSD